MDPHEIPEANHPIWKIMLYALLLLGVLHGASDPSVLTGVMLP